jgi:hypothetical protein
MWVLGRAAFGLIILCIAISSVIVRAVETRTADVHVLWVARAQSGESLYAARIDQGERFALRLPAHPLIGVGCSPNGDYFALLIGRAIYVYSAAGELLHQAPLAEDFIRSNQIDLSNDGTRALLVAGNSHDLILIDMQTGAETRFREYGNKPDLAPDGNRILFTTESYVPTIYTTDLHGESRSILQRAASDAMWSPNGNSIAFSGLDSNIYLLDAARALSLPLTRGAAYHLPQGWLPDGTRVLVYVRERVTYNMTRYGSELVSLHGDARQAFPHTPGCFINAQPRLMQ